MEAAVALHAVFAARMYSSAASIASRSLCVRRRAANSASWVSGAVIPLAVPFLAQGTIGPIGVIAALAVSATMVDVSPFPTNGALVLANAKDVDRDRQLLVYGGIVVAVAPLVAWLVFVVPGWG